MPGGGRDPEMACQVGENSRNHFELPISRGANAALAYLWGISGTRHPRRARSFSAVLDGGVDPNACGSGGFTALMWAAARGHIEVVQSLLGAGARSAIQTQKGRTAGDIAVQEGWHDVAALLAKPDGRA